MVQFLSIIFFFLDFFNFCWVFQKFPFFCVTLYKYFTLLFKCHILLWIQINQQFTTDNMSHFLHGYEIHFPPHNRSNFLGLWWWQMMKLSASSFCFRLNTVHFLHRLSAQNLSHFCISKTVQNIQIEPQDTYCKHQRKELFTLLPLNPQVY